MALAAKRYPVAPIPAALEGRSFTTETYKQLISLAMKEQLELQDVDYRHYPTKVFTLSPTMDARLREIALERYEGDEKAAFVGLCEAGIRHAEERNQERKAAAQQLDIAIPFKAKSNLQAQYFESVSKVLADNRILYAEGSTGIGKGRVLCAVGVEKARSTKALVAIAAPTVATVEQLYNEAESLGIGDVQLRILAGASEFVDDLLLRAAIEEWPEEASEAVRNWVASGARPLHPDRPLVKSIGPGAAWLRNDLAELAGDMDISNYTLRFDVGAESDSRAIVRKLREVHGETPTVLFCTHHLLALAQKTQWKMFPAPSLLIVDEAHLLEQHFSLVNTRSLSMHSLRSVLARERRLNKLGAASAVGRAYKQSQALSEELKAMRKAGDVAVELAELGFGQRQDLRRITSQLAEQLKSKGCAGVPLVHGFGKALEGVIERLDRIDRSGEMPTHNCYLHFSRVRGFPSLSVGPVSLNMQLGALWKASEQGVVLASASLFTPSATDEQNCDYMRAVLNTPVARTVYASPIIDQEIYNLPTLHVPSIERAARLRPASEGDARKQWQCDVANFVAQEVLPTAKGGVMLLNTAYEDIEGISQHLQASAAQLQREVVCMQRGTSFMSAVQAYRSAYAAGKHPIFLALGPAWTGLDLTDSSVEAGQDFLLTDVIIPKLPVNLNASNTMRNRFNRIGMTAVVTEALLTFKQGLGRVIRRHGVTDRRIWVLDGRVFDGQPWNDKKNGSVALIQLTATVRRMLKSYLKIVLH